MKVSTTEFVLIVYEYTWEPMLTNKDSGVAQSAGQEAYMQKVRH